MDCPFKPFRYLTVSIGLILSPNSIAQSPTSIEELDIDSKTIEYFAEECDRTRSSVMCLSAGMALTLKDPSRSKQYLGKACEEGISRACEIVLERDPNSGKRHTQTYLNNASLCNAGDGRACYWAGISTTDGTGVGKDLKKSRVWFTLGCDCLLYTSPSPRDRG